MNQPRNIEQNAQANLTGVVRLALQKGFSVIELLLASAITIILLGIIAFALRGGVDSTRFVQNSQVLLEDLRSTGNYMTDTLSGAMYLYRPGQTLTLASPNAYTVQNPITNTNTWVIGSVANHPILAAILPPRNLSKVCPPPVATPNDFEGCYAFVAFYALNRGSVVSSATGAAQPEPSPTNNDKWMIYSYLRYLDYTPYTRGASSPLQLPNPLPTSFSGASGLLVADYIQPGSFIPQYPQCLDFDGNGLPQLVLCSAAGAGSSAARASFTLQGQLAQGGRIYSIPASGLSLQIAPRNLPKRPSS